MVIQIEDGQFNAPRYVHRAGAVRLLLKTRGTGGPYAFGLDELDLRRELPASGSVVIPCGPLSAGEHVMQVRRADGRSSTAILEVAPG